MCFVLGWITDPAVRARLDAVVDDRLGHAPSPIELGSVRRAGRDGDAPGRRLPVHVPRDLATSHPARPGPLRRRRTRRIHGQPGAGEYSGRSQIAAWLDTLREGRRPDFPAGD